MKGNGSSAKHGSATRKVTLYPSRKLIEVAPGIKVAPLAKEHVPEIAIIKWQAVGDGTYRPLVKVFDPEIRVTEAARILHIDYKTLRRLVDARFVDGTQPSPGFYQVNLASWFEHVERVRKDPEFWSRRENKQRYNDAL
jgi:hypothetical protein